MRKRRKRRNTGKIVLILLAIMALAGLGIFALFGPADILKKGDNTPKTAKESGGYMDSEGTPIEGWGGNSGDATTGDGSGDSTQSPAVSYSFSGESEIPVFEPYHIHLMMVGDNLFHTGLVNEGKQADGTRNYDFEFEGVMQDLIRAADIRIINQESPLGGDDREFTSYPVFNTPSEVGDATAKAGFNVVIAATNHARDAGQSGVIHMSDFYATKYPEMLVCGIHGSVPQTQSIEIRTENADANEGFKNYHAALDAGVDPEIAKALLPYTPKYQAGTIDNLIETYTHDLAVDNARKIVEIALSGQSDGSETNSTPDPDEQIDTEYGTSSPSRIKMAVVDGYKFAILNYTYSINWESWPADVDGYIERLNPYNDSRMLDFETLDTQVLADIAAARQIADIVVVCPHWGVEYTFRPIERQVRFANQMIDAGADLIIGAHPHVIEPIEEITTDKGNKGLCFYSVGNYISTQDHPERVLEMMAWVSFKVDGDGISIDMEETGGLPLVNHYTKSGGFTHRIYALEDYTEELANAHGMKYHGDCGIVRLSDLQTWASQVIGDRMLTKEDILDK